MRITGIGRAFLVQNATQSVRLDADDNIIDCVTVGVAGRVLNVGFQQGPYSDIIMNFRVSMKTVELLEISGTGRMMLSGPAAVAQRTIAGVVNAGDSVQSGRTSRVSEV